MHTGEKPYSCDVCQKSYAHRSALCKHNKTDDHVERMKSDDTDITLTQSSFVDCGKSIKKEDIKEEIKEKKSFDDPSSLIYSTERYTKQEIREEVDEAQGYDDTDNLADGSEYVQVQMNLSN